MISISICRLLHLRTIWSRLLASLVPDSGPDHVDNFLYVLGDGFNSSIKSSYDEFNCFLAGLDRTKRAVRIALRVSQDHTLLEEIDQRDRPIITLFHDTQLFKRVSRGIARRTYLKGKQPPDYRGDFSSPYTEEEVKLIAERLLNRGKEMWSQGFIGFMKLTSYYPHMPQDGRFIAQTSRLGPREFVSKIRTLLENIMDINFDGEGVEEHFYIKGTNGRSYRVSRKQLQKFAMDNGHPWVRSVQPSASAYEPQQVDDDDEEITSRTRSTGEEGERYHTVQTATAPSDQHKGIQVDNVRVHATQVAETPEESEIGQEVDQQAAQGNIVLSGIRTIRKQLSNTMRKPKGQDASQPYRCGMHKNGELYPKTKDDYDDSSERCKAINKSSGKQCDSRNGPKKGG